MLLDRDSLMTLISDKARVRSYVTEKGWGTLLIPLLWSGTDPDAIPFSALPERFIIKTNHGCGFNMIVRDKNSFDHAEAKRQLNIWLARNFTYTSFVGMAWAYKNIQPAILIEELLDDRGGLPRDYKFFCYGGRAEYLQVSVDRFGTPSEQILDREFNRVPLYNGVTIYEGKLEKPKNYNQMLSIADSLSQGMDFIRVDLYDVDGRIYFGELTCYPAGGLARFVPRKYDFALGEKWVVGKLGCPFDRRSGY
jgi:hypothetical protein